MAQEDDVAVLARESLRWVRLRVLGSCAYLVGACAALWWAHVAPTSTVGKGVRPLQWMVVVGIVFGIPAAYAHLRLLLGARAVFRRIEAGDGERRELRVGRGSRRQVLELLDGSGVEVVLRQDERWLAPGRDVVVHGPLCKGGVVALVLPFGVRWRRIAAVQQPVVGPPER